MPVHFTKMHGLGNDFVVIDEKEFAVRWPSTNEWISLADRHTGIGFDQALVIVAARTSHAIAGYRIFNADGTEVEQCGNGARCVAEWLRLAGRTDTESIFMDSLGGTIEARFDAPGRISIDMGEPRFRSGGESWLDVAGTRVHFTDVSMGNPHIVLLVEDIDSAPVTTQGPALESHPAFPQRTNVGFLQIVDRVHGRLRVFERGVGETRACGTGACAAMAVGRRAGRFDDTVTLRLRGGELTLHWPGAGTTLWMTGPAAVAYRGDFDFH